MPVRRCGESPTKPGRVLTNAQIVGPLLEGGKRAFIQCLTAFDPGCVKTLRGITAPRILSAVVMRRAKKRKNLSSARHYDQIRFRFHTTKTPCGRKSGNKSGLDFRSAQAICHLFAVLSFWATTRGADGTVQLIRNFRAGSRCLAVWKVIRSQQKEGRRCLALY
jgi:hypothetical protein